MSYIPFEVRDWSLKPKHWTLYWRVLRALFELRAESKYVISFGLLATRAGLQESDVYQAATELKQQGFFDQGSREIGVVSLRPDEVTSGYRRTVATVFRIMVAESRTWQIMALGVATLASCVVWVLGNLIWDGIGPAVRAMLTALP